MAIFSGTFNNLAAFHYVLFDAQEKIIFDTENLSKVSFMNTDITRIRISNKARWGKENENKFKVIEEYWLEEQIKGKESPLELLTSGTVIAIYRNLRENYEFRLRYDEAGKFFTREMELKRKYREKNSVIKRNRWPRRNLSLTGLYYHFSTYGESILKPTLIGLIIVGLSTLFWLIQNNPIGEPSLSVIINNKDNFINVTQILNNTHSLKALERSLGDFLPLLSLGSNIIVGIIDYVVKIIGSLNLCSSSSSFEEKI